jgi:hypothetical protein
VLRGMDRTASDEGSTVRLCHGFPLLLRRQVILKSSVVLFSSSRKISGPELK